MKKTAKGRKNYNEKTVAIILSALVTISSCCGINVQADQIENVTVNDAEDTESDTADKNQYLEIDNSSAPEHLGNKGLPGFIIVEEMQKERRTKKTSVWQSRGLFIKGRSLRCFPSPLCMKKNF